MTNANQFDDLNQQLRQIEAENRYKPQEYISGELKSRPSHIPESAVGHGTDSDGYTSSSSSTGRSANNSVSRQRTSNSTASGTRSSTSSLQKGYREARHLAGGMIHHPSESTEHFSILRHSHGLVFYQGTSTSVAISVFADSPLPSNRTVWLKPKSSSGSSKNRATFRKQTDDLLDVTPAVAVNVEQVNPSDERAWHRDIVEFERRTRRGPRSKHRIRETDVIRIPVDAGDGYFKLVLCAGEKEKLETLCVSPPFRILSVSTQMGGVSGAHWSTLPLEIGAMALSIAAWNKVGAATILPLKMVAKNKTSPFMPAGATAHAGKAGKAGKLLYGASGASDRVAAEVAAFNSSYDDEREDPFTPAFKIDDDYESGPKTPFPIRFSACCDVDNRVWPERHIMPMLQLIKVPDIATYKLSGYYFGWYKVSPEQIKDDGKRKRRHHWLQAVIVVSPIDIEKLDLVTMSRANQKEVHIQILSDCQHAPPINTEITVEVSGCLRPWDQELEQILAMDMKEGEEVAFETAAINEMSDINLTQIILDLPAWSPEASKGKEEDEESEPKAKLHGIERVKQEYTEKRLKVQKKIDQVPLHKVSVRMPVDRMRDKSVVLNGYYVER